MIVNNTMKYKDYTIQELNNNYLVDLDTNQAKFSTLKEAQEFIDTWVGDRLQPFEERIIKDAFDKCFGLKEMLSDPELTGFAAQQLSDRTGMRMKFIKDHLEQIKTL